MPKEPMDVWSAKIYHRDVKWILAIIVFLLALGQQACERTSIPESLVDHSARIMLEEQGYRFFHYSSKQAISLDLSANIDNSARSLLTTPPTKNLVLAVLVGNDFSLGEIRAIYDGGSTTRSYGPGYGALSFQSVSSTKPPVLNSPFLSLQSAEHTLSLALKEK